MSSFFILSILFNFLLSIFYNKDISENNFIINAIDENMSPSSFIRPVISENGYLYIVTGEDNNNYNNRYILKFSIYSGDLINEIKYNINYGFWRGEVIVAGDNSEKLIITTFDDENFEKRTFEVYDMQKNNFSTSIFKVYGYRRTLKKVGSYIYYAYLEPNNRKILYIDKIKLINNSPYFQIVKQSPHNIEFVTYQSMISCDFTEDNKYMLCAYFNQNNKFSIVIFNSELEYISKKEFEDCSNDLEDAFIKIIYFKDNSKFIIMYTINKFTVRIRFVNYINNQLNNLFSPMFNNSEYLELNDTQDDKHDGLNDMIKFDSNKIIKIYTGTNEIILTV